MHRCWWLTLATLALWQDMAAMVDDDLLHRVVVVGTPAQVAAPLLATRGGMDRISPVAYGTDTRLFKAVLDQVKALLRAGGDNA